MSLIAAISMWMLVTCVLTTSASLSDKTVPLGARQPPTLLGVRQHLQHYEETFLQTAVHLTSSAPLLAAASTVLSYQIIDNDTVFDLSIQPTTRTDTTQLADSLGGLDLARGIEDSEENPIEKQVYDTSNDLVEEECPTGFDMLDCEDCGGPEQTWETRRHDYHCIGVSGFATHSFMHC
jgi:hypothetical protein